ncbi:hypothetical protein E3N88_28890 [Mikania micrantha]|uniref:Uncharacterized protein n=1 Tax=Mikania micrantha TaxID=192012 RepID=A0A5N6N0T1_9ASTR|nr:hypothetical protein E3N88_28890 [Mikania micrantha]
MLKIESFVADQVHPHRYYNFEAVVVDIELTIDTIESMKSILQIIRLPSIFRHLGGWITIELGYQNLHKLNPREMAKVLIGFTRVGRDKIKKKHEATDYEAIGGPPMPPPTPPIDIIFPCF